MNPNEHLMDLLIGRASEHARSLYQVGMDAYALASTPPPELGANVAIHPSPPASYPNNVVQFSRVHHALQVRVFVNQRVVWNIDSRSCPFAPLAFLSTLDLLGNTNAMMIPSFNLFHRRGWGRWMRGSSSIGPIYTPPPPAYIFFVRKNAFSRFDQFSQARVGGGVSWPSFVRPIYKSQSFRLREVRMAYQSGVGCWALTWFWI